MDDFGLNRYIDDINNWSSQFLEQISHYPTNGEYTAGYLVNRFIFHVITRKELDIENSVMYDINLLDTKNIDIDISTDKVVGDVFHGGAKRKIQRALSIYLENHPSILHEGDRRGRLYRYKLTRPRIKPKDVATYISKWMDLSGKEVYIRDPDIGNQVIAWATEFHISQEHETISNSYDSIFSGALEQYPQGQLPPKFSFEDDTIIQNYQKSFNSDLSEWCSNVYTRHWYQSIASNVLRYLRKEFDCLAEGSKRGRWIHKNHLVKDNQSDMFEAVSVINEFVEHFNVIHKKISNIENLEMRKSITNVLESHIQLMQGQIDIVNINRDIFTSTEKWSRDSSELTLENPLGRNHGIEPRKKKTIRDKVKKFLEDNPRSTGEILEHINSTFRDDYTSEDVENILAKNKNFIKISYGDSPDIQNLGVWARAARPGDQSFEDMVARLARAAMEKGGSAPNDDEMHKIADSEDGVQS